MHSLGLGKRELVCRVYIELDQVKRWEVLSLPYSPVQKWMTFCGLTSLTSWEMGESL